MEKILSTILTIAVLGVGYVGAKAFEKKATVRQDQAWYAVDSMGNPLSTHDPIQEADFDENQNCPKTSSVNCAALFSQDANGQPENRISEILEGEFTP
jgi:hypothetical protein